MLCLQVIIPFRSSSKFSFLDKDDKDPNVAFSGALLSDINFLLKYFDFNIFKQTKLPLCPNDTTYLQISYKFK